MNTHVKIQNRFFIKIPHFSLKMLALSHGWVNLSPFLWDESVEMLFKPEIIDTTFVKIYVSQGKDAAIADCRPSAPLSEIQLGQIRKRLKYMLSADIDLSEFLAVSKKLNFKIYKFVKSGGGRFLRGTTLYEDVVKTLLTTNASWAFTKIMCNNLIATCSGRSLDKVGMPYFPCPKDIYATPLQDLDKYCKLGYRGKYLKGISELFVENNSFEGWATPDVIGILSKTKGIGEYSVNHIKVLLGVYDNIPVDSEVTAYFKGFLNEVNTKRIQELYEPWHPFQFLAYKIERMLKNKNWIGN